MAARQAVGHHRARARSEADRTRPSAHDELASEYADEHLTAAAAARAGFVDEVDRARARRARASPGRCAPGRPAMRPFVALGDSFTAGTGCAPGESWADTLAEAMAGEDGLASTRTSPSTAPPAPTSVARSAAPSNSTPSSSRSSAAPTTSSGRSGDVDDYSPQPRRDPARSDQPAPDAMIVTATAPDRWEFLWLGPRTRARFEAELAALNTATRAVASLHGVEVLDVAGHPGLSRQENFAGDGLHPSVARTPRAAEASAPSLPIAFRTAGERSHFDDQRDLGAGTRLEPRRTITEADLVSFAAITGDWHPQHVDAEWAAQSRFGERIAHGMLVLSYSVGLMGFDPERVVALRGHRLAHLQAPGRHRRDDPRRGRRRATCRPIDDDHELVGSAGACSRATTACALRARVTIVHRNEVRRRRDEVRAQQAPKPTTRRRTVRRCPLWRAGLL